MFAATFNSFKDAVSALESNNYGTKSLLIMAFSMISQQVNRLQGETWAPSVNAFHDSMMRHWQQYFEVNRAELLIASRLNPSTCAFFTPTECVEVDQLIQGHLSSCHLVPNVQPESEQLEAPFQSLTFRSFVQSNNNNVQSTDEYCSYLRVAAVTQSPDPTEFDLWNFWAAKAKCWPNLHSLAMQIYHMPHRLAQNGDLAVRKEQWGI